MIKYRERLEHTLYDIIGATGGDLTFAIAIWVLLFGRGKYKSWGLIQRFILRNSPNVHKKDSDKLPFHDNDGKGNSNGEDDEDDKNKDNRNSNVNVNDNNINDDVNNDINSDNRTSLPYHIIQPEQQHQHHLEPDHNISDMIYGKGSDELADKEVVKKIIKMVDEKLLLFEQTISRHYLSGFRTSKYNLDLKKLDNDDCDHNKKHSNLKNDDLNIV